MVLNFDCRSKEKGSIPLYSFKFNIIIYNYYIYFYILNKKNIYMTYIDSFNFFNKKIDYISSNKITFLKKKGKYIFHREKIIFIIFSIYIYIYYFLKYIYMK